MKKHNQTVTYVLVNNLGGITSMLSNLAEFCGPDALAQEAVLLNIKENQHAPVSSPFGAGIPVKFFSYSKRENWYHVFSSLAKTIEGTSGGVMVSNDVYDMLMLQAFNIEKKVVQVVHDAYNVKLAMFHGDVVDKFICHSLFYYEVMCQFLGHRKNDIVHIPYGIPVTGKRRQPVSANEPLRLVFLGRHDEGKGIFDLFKINTLLKEKNIPVQWLIMGRGPETAKLKKQWEAEDNVVFDSPADYSGVFKNILHTDVLVFPTKFEGFPVALLEAMAAGVVPVATDLPGGLRELVKNGKNGYLCNEDDNAAFAERIAGLHYNRPALETMSLTAFDEVSKHFNAKVQSPVYQKFFKELASSPAKPRHHTVNKKIGSRLDQPWLPNIAAKILRGDYLKK